MMSAADQDFDEPQPPISYETAENWLHRLTRLLDGAGNLNTYTERTQSAPAECCCAELATAARWRPKGKSAVSADTRLMHDDLGEMSNPARAFSVQPNKIAKLAVSVWQYLNRYLSRWRNSQRYSVHEDYQHYGRWLRRDLGVSDDDTDWLGLQ